MKNKLESSKLFLLMFRARPGPLYFLLYCFPSVLFFCNIILKVFFRKTFSFAIKRKSLFPSVFSKTEAFQKNFCFRFPLNPLGCGLLPEKVAEKKLSIFSKIQLLNHKKLCSTKRTFFKFSCMFLKS